MKPKINFFIILFFFFLAIPLVAHGQQKEKEHEHGHGTDHIPFGSVEEYIKVLERADRAEWQKPDRVVDSLGLKNKDSVADIGAGSGYFTFRIAGKVGASGKVYAVDILPGMVEFIRKRMTESSVQNVFPILAEENDPMLAENSVDLVFIADTLHHISDRADYLKRLRLVLKKKGRLAIVDFKTVETPVGPPMKIRISRDRCVKEITDAGFSLTEEFDYLPYQYFLIFEK